jgi:hypothetical protein
VPWFLGAFASGTREEGVEVAGGRMSGGSWFVFAVLLVLVLVLVLALVLLVLLLVEMFLGLPYHRYCMDDGE